MGIERLPLLTLNVCSSIRTEQAELEKRLNDLESKVIVGGINLVSNRGGGRREEGGGRRERGRRGREGGRGRGREEEEREGGGEGEREEGEREEKTSRLARNCFGHVYKVYYCWPRPPSQWWQDKLRSLCTVTRHEY